MKKSKFFLDCFILKIIAMVSMTFDHLAVSFEVLSSSPISHVTISENMENVLYVFRIIGRIAFPLYIFLLVEGIYHTKNFWKYFLKLGIVWTTIFLPSIIAFFIDQSFDLANPITDLIAVSLMLYLLKRKDKYSFLAIIPALYLIGCYLLDIVYENQIGSFNVPSFLLSGYSIFAFMLAIGFYYAIPLAKTILNSNQNTEALIDTDYHRLLTNLLSLMTVIVSTTILYLLQKYVRTTINTAALMSYSFISGAFIFLYNGKRGYNKKWFQLGAYIYFPLHLILCAGISALFIIL